MTWSTEPCASMGSTCEMCGWQVFEQESVMSCRKASFSTGHLERICCWEDPLRRSRNCVLQSKLLTSRNYSGDCPRVGTHRWDQEAMHYREAKGNVLPWLARSCSDHRCCCLTNPPRPWMFLRNEGFLRA